MTTVTVCVPAYRAESFIGETLRSVQEQSHCDLRVEIAIDPSTARSNGTRAAIEAFLSDERFRVRDNSTRLGWAGNIRAMLERVVTPFFIILPHDDLLDPCYLETLLSVFEDRPDACVAYGDMTFFGHPQSTYKSVDLPANGSVDEQLLAFFLAGAEAVPWRGVTRVDAIAATGGFPDDGYGGFAVECEYALSLILHGPAVRVPRPLYRKRIHAPGVMTASRQRVMEASPERLAQAWRRHRSRMLALLDAAPRPITGTDLVRQAAQAAMLLRHCEMVDKMLPEAEFVLARQLLVAATHSAGSAAAHRVAETVRFVLAEHQAASLEC